jgi:hypothetical protein
MKLVREHINEKFTEDSDPIADMGIGTTIINFEKLRNEVKPEIGFTELKFWVENILPPLVGKKILGEFENVGIKKFIIQKIDSFEKGKKIVIYKNNKIKYTVIDSNDYYIFNK